MKNSPKKKTSISILLALSLPLLYLSLLNSPSNFIKDTAFWFLLSNSIVFIVAVDSGVFSAPDNTAIYDEFIRHNRSNSSPPYLVMEQSKSGENVKVERKSFSCSEIDEGGNNSRPQCLVMEQSKSEENVKVERKSISCSEIDEASVMKEKMKSSPAEKPAAPVSSSGEEESEYSKLSDEELNRKVEEFIMKFNRELSSKR